MTLEGDYKNYGFDGAYNETVRNASVTKDAPAGAGFPMFAGQAYDVSGMYMFPEKFGYGFVQPYVRYVNINPNGSTNRNTYQTVINYVIDGHNAIVSLNYIYGDMATKGITNFTSGVKGDNVSSLMLGFQWQI